MEGVESSVYAHRQTHTHSSGQTRESLHKNYEGLATLWVALVLRFGLSRRTNHSSMEFEIPPEP